MRIGIDRDRCAVHGVCEYLAPDHFEITDDGDLAILRDDVPDERLAVLEEAVQGCPTSALRLLA
jgi:ferredoxin